MEFGGSGQEDKALRTFCTLFQQSHMAVVSVCVLCAVCVWVFVPVYSPLPHTSRQMTLREIGIFQQMVSALKGPIADAEVRKDSLEE